MIPTLQLGQSGRWALNTGGGGGGGASDPHFANVILLLECEGTADSVVYPALVDSSSYARTCTSSSTGMHRTAQKKWGSTAIGRNNGGQFNVLYSNAIFTMGDTWTLEWWQYQNNAMTGWGGYIGHQGGGGGNNGRWFMGTDVSDVTKPSYWLQGNPFLVGATGLILTGTWQYNAVSVNAGIAECYISSGGATASRWATGNVGADAYTDTFFVGGGVGTIMDGYQDSIRLTKGVARYTGPSIAVPTGPFPNS